MAKIEYGVGEDDPGENRKITLTAEEARGGKELGVMRYVLQISLGLAVIAGIVIYTIFFHGS